MQTSTSKLATYASSYRDLFSDQRLFDGFLGTLQGILGSQSLHMSKIANAVLKRLLSVYQQRWAIEDLFAELGPTGRALPVLLEQKRPGLGERPTHVVRAVAHPGAFTWLAAAFLHGLGADLADEGVQFLARLGGWRGGDSKPGARTFATGIAQLASYLLVTSYAPQLGGDDALMALAYRLLPAP